MDFTKGLSTILIGIRIAIAIDPPNRFVTDNLRTFLRFVVNDNFVRTVNFIVGENAILKNKPSRSPSFPVIHPLIQYPGDSIPDEIINLHIENHRRRLPLTPDTLAQTMSRNRVGSNSQHRRRWWRRNHGEIRKRRRRGFHRRSLIGDSGYTAERMHVAGKAGIIS